jgi:hypothetical protein
MRLVKSVLRVNLVEASKPFLDLRSILRTAGRDEKVEIQASPFVIERPKDKKRTTVQIRGILFEDEAPGALDSSLGDALEILDELNKIAPLAKVGNVRHDVIYIEPCDVPFHELVSIMKDRYLAPGRLAQTSTDIGLVFDLHEDRFIKHLHVGPMDKTQITSTFLRWPDDTLPDVFVFANLGLEEPSGFDYSAEAMRDFITACTNWQADEAARIFEEALGEG